MSDLILVGAIPTTMPTADAPPQPSPILAIPFDVYQPILSYLCYVDQMALVSTCRKLFAGYRAQLKPYMRQLLFERIADSFNELVGCTDTNECNAAHEVFNFMSQNECMLSGSFILSCLYDKGRFTPNDIDLFIIADPDRHYSEFIYEKISQYGNDDSCDYLSKTHLFTFMCNTIEQVTAPLRKSFKTLHHYPVTQAIKNNDTIFNEYQYCPVKMITKEMTFSRAQNNQIPPKRLQINVLFRSCTTQLLARLMEDALVINSISCSPIAVTQSGCWNLEDFVHKTFDFDICKNAFIVHVKPSKISTHSQSNCSFYIGDIQALFTRTSTLKLDHIRSPRHWSTDRIIYLYQRYLNYRDKKSFKFNLEIGDELYCDIMSIAAIGSFGVILRDYPSRYYGIKSLIDDNITRVTNFHIFCDLKCTSTNRKTFPDGSPAWQVADYVLLPRVDNRVIHRKRQKLES